MVIICPTCHAENAQGAILCVRCAAPMGLTCVVCGFISPSAAQYCIECGIPLEDARPGSATDAPMVTPAPLQVSTAVRRMLTVMFCDLVGSTKLSTRVDAEILRELMARYRSRAAEIVRECHGLIARYTGDGITVYFGYPRAREDDAECAVRASLALVDAISLLEVEGIGPLQLRVGVATGTVIVGDIIGDGVSREISIFGESPNLAARLVAIASPNAVVVDEKTHHLTSWLFDWEALGARLLKGFDAPIAAWRALRARTPFRRFAAINSARSLTRFIGRQAEIDLILDRAELASSGRLELLLVSGDAGIGKSRLLHEVRQRLSETNTAVLIGHCTPDGRQTTYAPFIEILKQALGLQQEESGAEARRRILARVAIIGCRGPETDAVLLNLLGLGEVPQVQRVDDPLVLGRRTRDALGCLLRALCKSKPLALFIEDIHWIDYESEGLLGELLADKPPPCLLVGTFRPPYQPPPPLKAVAQRIDLLPLSGEQTELLIHSRLGQAAPNAVVHLILNKSEGNPLFAEELIELVRERNRAADRDRADTDLGLDHSLSTPYTIDKITMSRVDRLKTDVRNVLHIAAGIGRDFSLDVLAAVSKAGDALPRILQELADRDLIFAHAAEPGLYVFKHALVRDAIYNSQLATVRRKLHLSIAQEIERQRKDRLSEAAEQLAAHYRDANQNDKAVLYLKMAGEKCLAIYALRDADRHFSEAIAILESSVASNGHRILGAILVCWMRTLEFSTAFAEIIRLAERYLPAIERAGNQLEISQVLSRYAHALLHRHDYSAAHRVAQRALLIADTIGSKTVAAEAQLVLMKVYSASALSPDQNIVLQLGSQIIAAAEQAADSYLACAARFQLAVHHMYAGDLRTARRAALDLVSQGVARNDARARGFASWLLGWLDLHEEDYVSAMRHADDSIQSAMIVADRMVGSSLKGAVYALVGQPEAALELLTPIRQACVLNSDKNLLTAIDPPFGVALLRSGQLSRGLRFMEEAIRERRRDGYVAGAYYGLIILAETYLVIALREKGLNWKTLVRNLGFVLLVAPFAGRRAERYFRAAAKNPGWREGAAARVRIDVGLGRLYSHQGRWVLAREHLERARKAAELASYSFLQAKAEAALAALPVRKRLEQAKRIGAPTSS